MADDLEEDIEEEEGMEDGGGGSSGGGLKRILLILVPILLLIAAVAGLYFGGVFTKITAMFKPAPAPVAGAPGTPPAVPAVVFYDLPEMLVNLNSEGRVQHYLKIRVTLQLTAQTDVPVVEAVMPVIVDNFQVYLRELRVEDLNGSEGPLRLREELLDRVNAAVKPVKVRDVLFKEMLVQ